MASNQSEAAFDDEMWPPTDPSKEDEMRSPTDHFKEDELLDTPDLDPSSSIGKIVELAYSGARPDLRFLAKELKRQTKLKTPKKKGVAVLKFPDSPRSPVPPPPFDGDWKALEKDLKESVKDVEENVKDGGKLYILEDISKECVEIFCSQLKQLDPSFFARHLRVTRWEFSSRASNAPPLPSTDIKGVHTFVLRYPELVVFPSLNIFGGRHRNSETKDEEDEAKDEEDEAKDGKDGFRRCFYCDCNLYREITFARPPVGSRWAKIGLIRRRLSFWSWKPNNKAWVGKSKSCSLDLP